MNTNFNTETQRLRAVYALLEMKRIVEKASAEGWVVEEVRNPKSEIRMVFVNRRTGSRVAGASLKDRKGALASACREMQGSGF